MPYPSPKKDDTRPSDESIDKWMSGEARSNMILHFIKKIDNAMNRLHILTV